MTELIMKLLIKIFHITITYEDQELYGQICHVNIPHSTPLWVMQYICGHAEEVYLCGPRMMKVE